MFPQVEEPRQTRVRRCGDLALNAESEDGLRGRCPFFRYPKPASFTRPFQTAPGRVLSDEAHIRVSFVGRPVVMEVFQKVMPVTGESVLFKVGQRKREGVVDADNGGNVPVEFLAEPFSQSTASPPPAWARRRLNLNRFTRAFGHENTNALATGVCGFRAGIVDADVACECWLPTHSSFPART